jgi:S-formylglutathione hydrolase FrmB
MWQEPHVLAGRVERSVIDSRLLTGNPLGDPSRRPVLVYLPPGYDRTDERYPVVYVAHGYTIQVDMWLNRPSFLGRNYPELLDAMFAAGEAPPAIVVFADGWNRFGGSQFLDSPGTGRYQSFLCDEIVGWVDARYRTIADREHRAITGKSSGGYAAMTAAMMRPDVFGAFATHCGDALFDVTYRWEMPRRAQVLRRLYGGSYEAFLNDLEGREVGSEPDDLLLLSGYACAAAYSADDDGTVTIPFDENGLMVPPVWERWLAWDPVLMAARPQYADALRSMRGIWIDAGDKDEFFLDLAASAFRRAVAGAGVPDDRVHYEIFPGGHFGIEHRYPPAVSWLCRLLGR